MENTPNLPAEEPLEATQVASRDINYASRVLRASDALKCCEKRSQNLSKKRLLLEISDWIQEIQEEIERNHFRGGPGDPDGHKISVTERGNQGLYTAQLIRGGNNPAANMGLQMLPAPPPVGGAPFPGETVNPEFQRLLRLPRPVTFQPGAPAPIGGPIVLGAMLIAAGAEALYSYHARQSTQETLDAMRVATARLAEEIPDEEATEDCEECIKRALLSQERKQVWETLKIRRRV